MSGGTLRWRDKTGLVIALVALSICLDPVNLRVREWLRHDLVGGAPFWLDHLLFMMTLELLVWSAIGFLILGPAGLGLARPARPREAWTLAVATGVGILAPIVLALALSGKLAFKLDPNVPLILANFVSNFYEELIFRGAILGL